MAGVLAGGGMSAPTGIYSTRLSSPIRTCLHPTMNRSAGGIGAIHLKNITLTRRLALFPGKVSCRKSKPLSGDAEAGKGIGDWPTVFLKVTQFTVSQASVADHLEWQEGDAQTSNGRLPH